GAIAQLHVGGALRKRRFRKRNVCDQLSVLNRCFDVRSGTGQLVEFLDWNPALTLRAYDVHNSIECDKSNGHVRGMRGDAMLTATQHGMDAIETFQRGAARAWLSLVASRIRRIAKVIATRTLHQVAASCRHVAELCRCACKERLGKSPVPLHYCFVMRKIAVANHCTDAQSAIGQSLDLVQRQRIDVHKMRGRLHVELHEINESRPSGNCNCPGLTKLHESIVLI